MLRQHLDRLKIYAEFAAPFRLHLGIIFLLLLAGALLETLSLTLLVPIINLLTSETGEATAFREMYTLLASWGLPPRLALFLLLFLGVLLLRNGVRYTEGMYRARLQRDIVAEAGRRIFDNLMNVGYAYYHQARKGEIINFVNNGASNLMFVMFHLIEITLTLLMIVCYAGLLFALSARLSLLALCVSSLGMALYRPLFSSVKRLSTRQVESSQRFNSEFVEVLDGIKVVKAYGCEDLERERLRRNHGRFLADICRVQQQMAKMGVMGSTFGFLVMLGMFVLAREYFQMPFALLSVFFLVLYRTIPLVQRLPQQFGQLVSTLAPLELAYEGARRDNKPYITDGTRPCPQFRASIVFSGVSFRYRDTFVLHDIALLFRKQQTTAIIGATGSGKSTLVDLLLRLYDPQEGMISVDGVPLRELRLADWRRRIAIVLQDTFLFNDTVANNIRYSQPAATDDDVTTAARLANADTFIRALPQGYATVLGERGVTLSGGQKQMLALARALVRRPDILILDEATSSLDNASEHLVQQALTNLYGNMTVIIIAHRLSTVRHADWLVVLDGGEMVESGKPAELLQRQDSWYAHYHRLQFAGGAADAADA